MKNLQWFKDRVGMTIYRLPLSYYGHKCPCEVCKGVSVKIFSETHAQYVYDCQIEEGIRYHSKMTTAIKLAMIFKDYKGFIN
jgi:hypothetical protein